MTNTTTLDVTPPTPVREVVGVFPTQISVEAVVERLESTGVDRAAISVLAMTVEAEGSASARAVADDPSSPRQAFVSHASMNEGKAFAIALPMQIGGFAGAWAVAAAGGALAVAIGATLAGGVVGGGLGALLVRAVARHHAADIHGRLANGETVVWVSTPDAQSEERALELMNQYGGASVHAHAIERGWSPSDRPLSGVQPDPFLEKDN
jgi:outer membrane lipoprotein SlyB